MSVTCPSWVFCFVALPQRQRGNERVDTNSDRISALDRVHNVTKVPQLRFQSNGQYTDR